MKVCRSYSLLKDVMFEKLENGEKIPWLDLNLQPSDLHLNTYRSLPGSQVFSPYYLSCIYIYRNSRKWRIIFKYP